MFAYCGNNPVNRFDPTGYDWLNDFIDWVEKKKEEASENKGTISNGINISCSCGGGFFVSFGIVRDFRGNVGIIVSSGVGGGFPSTSVMSNITVTEAPDIYKLNGAGTQIGGSVNVCGVSAGVEHVMAIDSEKEKAYQGVSFSVGPKASIPAEMHGEYGKSKVYGINLFDWLIGTLEAIAE